MTLSDFLLGKGYTQREFAQLVGISQPAIARYVAGRRMPLRKHLMRIREVTDGKVTADDFLPGEAAE